MATIHFYFELFFFLFHLKDTCGLTDAIESKSMNILMINQCSNYLRFNASKIAKIYYFETQRFYILQKKNKKINCYILQNNK